MNKDVIYIDVEDDITAIIGKIKASKEKIVALVPPKRIGVLQSAVNLHLLVRMAKNADKRLVLITGNQALIALSAAASIPVARNLQSKPELAEIPALAVDDDEDIIDGSLLPVGELERTADGAHQKGDVVKVNKLVDTIDVDDDIVPADVALRAAAVRKQKYPKSNVKIPNFNKFRKRLFIGLAALALLIIFFIWANVFAPAATVIVTAKTVASPVSGTITLGGSAATNLTTGTLQTVTQQLRKDSSATFTATGQKNIGTPASGTLTLSNGYTTENSISVPSGSHFTDSSGSFTFVTTQAVTVPRASFVGGLKPGTANVNVQATAPGTDYNLAPGAYSSDDVDGITAQGGQMSGGTTKIATVVTNDDVQKATDALSQQSSDNVKKQLIGQFKNGEIVISDSFTVVAATPVSTPAVGAEASSPATLTASTTYTITAIAKPDVELYLKNQLDKQLDGKSDQRIYDDGIKTAKLSGYDASGSSPTVNIAATGQIGPNIDENAIKKEVKNKKSGEVQALLGQIQGVSDVKVNFSYFWVTRIPNDINKIDVQFKLTNA